MGLGKRGERHDACSAAQHAQEKLFGKLKRRTLVVDFERFGEPRLSELADSTYELDAGGAEKLLESF